MDSRELLKRIGRESDCRHFNVLYSPVQLTDLRRLYRPGDTWRGGADHGTEVASHVPAIGYGPGQMALRSSCKNPKDSVRAIFPSVWTSKFRD